MRGRRLFELKKELGSIQGLDWWDLDHDRRRSFDDRTVTKDELIECCERLGIETHGTVGDLRNRLRIGLGDPGKSPNSRLSRYELRKLHRVVEHAMYLEAEELSFVAYEGDEVKIDGHVYRVVATDSGPCEPTWYDGDRFELYESYTLDASHIDFGRRRLMILHGLSDECSYDHSVILEYAREYGPWKRWEKFSYVRELDVLQQVIETQ